jgi:hypothetical protein
MLTSNDFVTSIAQTRRLQSLIELQVAVNRQLADL